MDHSEGQKKQLSINVAETYENFSALKKQGVSGGQNSEISVKQFLDFLKTAYQVHDSLEGILMAEGMTDVVDWIKLKENDVVKAKKDENGLMEPSSSTLDEKMKTVQANDAVKRNSSGDLAPLSEKLNEILTEGIADSVLPYLVSTSNSSTVCIQRRPSIKALEKPSTSNVTTSSGARRKTSNASLQKIPKADSEVEIHVCDEVNGVKKDFVCNQKLLVEQMGYFADVTRDQKLDDMDISVHCDINIFDWLMRWVKRDTVLEADRPELEIQNAVPVLVSASFLQMEPLLQECLYYCHRNMNEILKTAASLSCLNDSLLTRLADMYTNVEVESLRDRKDKIQSRLFCKLIQSLCDVEPESLRGHYCSLARIYRCKYCQQLINPIYAEQVPCIPNCMSLQTDGSIKNKHVRDPTWDINDFVVGLHKSLKTWRKVYWKLWGCAHFLFCIVCKKYFPARQEGWCRFHTDRPQFFTLDAQKPPLPVGRYPCCGERAYRFQLIDDRSGCCFRDHTVSTKDVKDASVAGMLDSYRNLITEEPPQLVFPDRLTRLVAREPTDPDDGKLESKETLWWEGLEIVPPRPKMGLLGAFGDRRSSEDETQEEEHDTSFSEEDSSESSTSTFNSPGSEESETLPEKQKKCKRRGNKVKKCVTRLWQQNLSARSNQDLQRAHEETAFKQMANILNGKTLITSDDPKLKNRGNNPPGGVWVRLESEWREKNVPVNKNKNIYSGKVRMKTTRLL